MQSNCVSIQKKIIDVGGLIALAEARTKNQNDVRVSEPVTHALLLLVSQESQGKESIPQPYSEPLVFWKSYV